MNTEKITIWEKLHNMDGNYQHNHIESGWSEEYKPISISNNVTENWKNSEWRKSFGYLKIMYSIEKVETEPNLQLKQLRQIIEFLYGESKWN